MRNQTLKRFLILPIAFLICLISTTALACIDYSGQYHSVEDNGNVLTLTLSQKACDSLVMDHKYSDGAAFTKTMIFDGTFRVIFDEPTFKTIEAFSITDSEIQFAAKLENKITGSKHTLKGTFIQDSEGNLIEDKTFFNPAGKRVFKVIIVHTPLTARYAVKRGRKFADFKNCEL